MGLKNQKHLRRSAIAKKQHSNSSRRFENLDVTIESSVQSLSPSRHDCQYLQTHCKKNARIRKFN